VEIASPRLPACCRAFSVNLWPRQDASCLALHNSEVPCLHSRERIFVQGLCGSPSKGHPRFPQPTHRGQETTGTLRYVADRSAPSSRRRVGGAFECETIVEQVQGTASGRLRLHAVCGPFPFMAEEPRFAGILLQVACSSPCPRGYARTDEVAPIERQSKLVQGSGCDWVACRGRTDDSVFKGGEVTSDCEEMDR